MYFFNHAGKQCLDLKGDFILSHNDKLIKSRSKSAGPSSACNGTFFDDITNRKFKSKFIITILAIWFIWGKSEALTIDDTNYKKPIVKDES